ncbi:hypothetical protein SKAU_G00376620 [Synaphobranchus kaupii]|uniref:Rho GTPase-activating protein 30 n=1 Tax=Synaphobranchus kaupii TaxID=118154 RepID=A0A9Q1ECS6_SYNKA|nr:hypothetical protein SKAU_G00376620 [Synaphobranchus kaupii]
MRRGRKKAANKDRVFGCDLLEHLAASSQEIPQVLRCCSQFIEEHGIVDGIYRLSGVSSNTQKLRGEFDSEVPDLGKEVYLQDIHCVSSLCKAYFRELPNPLLTYQLYDKFADAVAVQLEEERLVKIKEVLKDLPLPHYRTLEYLMRHLVKMATFASETNMHSRNLAIVWAPNLLRSRDIEATGLNGTAAFMEVRVQSIVVEFILTHVSQLFSIPGLVSERRKSLPSPSVLSSQEEPFFRALPYNFPSTLSPGNGPPAMRSYHAIIEGTDKRKGSLKGRKWKSIFNLGGRLHDTRRKNKSNGKEKEKVSLRPAKSMDSLSSAPYTPEGTRPHLSPSPLAQPSPNLGREAGSPGGVVGGAVGGAGSGLDSGENTATDSPSPQPRSPGISSRAERRAGMHISGPFSVTVPLHITSGLALGLLQGGANREEGAVQREEGGANIDEGVVTREEGGADRENVGSHTEEGREGRREQEGKRDESGEGGAEGKKTEVNRLEEAGTGEEVMKERFSVEEVMKESFSVEETEPVGAEEELDSMDKSGTSSPEDHDSQLPLDFQDTFGFLDLMDSSAYNQVNEFSVEPPCFEEEEDYDEEEPGYPGESPSMLTPEKLAQPPQTHRPLTSDPYGHPCKSHSLPYKSRPFLPAPSSSSSSSPSEDEDEEEGSDEEENMLFYSLPSRLQFQAARERETDTHTKADADAQGQNTNANSSSNANSNVNAFGQSEGGLEHSVPRPPDTDWLVAVAVSMPGELGQNGSTEVEDSLELKTKMEEEGEPPANTANGERDYTVALTDTHEPRCFEGESGFAVRDESQSPALACIRNHLVHLVYSGLSGAVDGGADYGEKLSKLFVKDCDPQCTSEGGEQVTLPTSVEDGKKPDTEPTPAGDPEELNEQHRCGHGDEELSAVEFVVKAETEEEHVAQRLNQTGCEHSAGGLNNLGSEYVMYEGDSQLWTSFTQGDSDIETDDPVCSNSTEQCSQSLSVHSPLQHGPATMEVSGNPLSSFGASSVEGFDKMSEKPSVCSEELRSEAIHTQQGQYRERLVHTVERENQSLLPQQQQHGPSVKHMRGSGSPAQPHSALSTSAFNTGRKEVTDGPTDFGKKPFSCTHCGKGFAYFSCYKVHLRSHTGEKPYSCAQCGKRFTQQSNLTKHESVHSGNKPFNCLQCGKSFRYRSILTLHLRIHSGERPFHCMQCGKSFAQSSHFKRHQRSHTGKKPYSCF